MDINALKRNPKRIIEIFVNKKGSIYTKEKITIMVPKRYMNKGLLVVGERVLCLGILPIITEDGQYGVLNIISTLELTPDDLYFSKVNDIEYVYMIFEKDSMVIASDKIVVSDEYIYGIFDEFIILGNIPWFLDYEDMGKIFDSAKKYGGSHVGKTPAAVELIASVIGRDPNDRKVYYRRIIESRKDLVNKTPVFVPMNSVFYSTSNTTAKVIGSYFSDGLVSALTDKVDTVENIESLLRQ